MSCTACGRKGSSEDYGEFQWPKNEIAKLIPIPKSSVGKIVHESNDRISIDVAKTEKKQYDEYVNDCMEKGFDVDYSKSDTHFSAENQDGYSLWITFDNNKNVMGISLNKPEDVG